MFPNSLKLFDVLGFRVSIDPSWFLIAALIVWSLSTGYFPEEVPGIGQFDSVAYSIAAMVGLFAGLILHELAHSLVARRFGLGVGGITLFLFGGVAELEQDPDTPNSEVWIALAGPAMSLVLSGAAWAVAGAAVAARASPALVAMLGYLASVNLVIALFNMLPAFPLDGGRVLRAVLWRMHGDVLGATRVAAAMGTTLGIALMVLGFMALFGGTTAAAGLWPILLGLFLIGAARGTYRQMLVHRMMRGRTVGDMMTGDPSTTGPGRSIREVVDAVMLGHGVSFVPVIEDGRAIGYLDTRAIRSIDTENWDTTRVGDVFVVGTSQMYADPDMPLDALMERIGSTGRRKFMVQRDGLLVGVVTLSDILRSVNIFGDLGGERLLSSWSAAPRRSSV